MSLTWVPGRQHASLGLRSGLQMGPSISLSRESPPTTTFLSRQRQFLGNLLGEPSPASSLTSPSMSSAINLLLRGTWGREGSIRGVCPWYQAGALSQPSPSLRLPPHLTGTEQGVHHQLCGISMVSWLCYHAEQTFHLLAPHTGAIPPPGAHSYNARGAPHRAWRVPASTTEQNNKHTQFCFQMQLIGVFDTA